MPVSAVVEPTRGPNMSTPWKCTFLHVSSASCSIARVQSMKALWERQFRAGPMPKKRASICKYRLPAIPRSRHPMAPRRAGP